MPRAEAFWIFLDHHSWVHACDAKGRRRPFSDMPERFEAARRAGLALAERKDAAHLPGWCGKH